MLVLTSGVIVVDRIAAGLPEEPHSGKTQYTERPIEEHIGGHAANVAIDLVKLGILPEEVGVAAAIGNDSGGEFIERTLRMHGICNFLQKKAIPTCQNLILVPEGRDRSFNIAPGANLELTAEHVVDVLEHMKPKALSIRPGYTGIDFDMASILETLSDTFVLLDFIKPFKKDPSYILPALEFTHAFHCNSHEAMMITGRKTIEASCNMLFENGVRCLFITDGEKGARLFNREHTIKQSAFQVETIDPTGCGDAFCAGILKKVIELEAYSLFDSLTYNKLEDILRYAQAVGAACATAVGTTAGVSQERVKNILMEKK